MKTHYQVLIIGGGTGGIMTAAMLLKKRKNITVGIIEPSDTHYYQPAWTLVGAGTFDMEKTKRPQASVMPDGADWIKEYATRIDLEKNEVTTTTKTLTYDYLVVSPGLVMAPEMIEGLPEALEKGVVCSNYTDPEKTWELMQEFKGGNAIFTQPTTPIKCGGAPQKIAYLAADYWGKNGVMKKTNLIFATPGSVIFGVKEIRETLMDVIRRYGINFKPQYAPVKIDAEKKIITFRFVGQLENGCVINTDPNLKEKVVGDTIIEMPFDFLHLAPPQKAPKFVIDSGLCNEGGWMDVDIHTLQHKKYKNVFGLGDVAALPTAKTGAAIRKQVPVLLENIFGLMDRQQLGSKAYNGYSSCPLVTGYGKMVLAEFDYDNKFTPDPKLKQLLIKDSSKEHWRLWILKKYILPYLYWNKMMKGEEI